MLLYGQNLFPQDRAPRLEDFAGSLVLTGAAGGLLRFEIPEDLYRGLERPDMGDIRVFDAQGLPVPFTIRETAGSSVDPPPVELPFFPWAEENDVSLPSGADIVIDAEGTILNIKGRTGRPAASYLLDLSRLETAPSMLAVSLGKEGEIYNTAVRIYASADLARWREFGKSQVLAWFGEEGTGREFLELPPGENRYLLLKFDKTDLPPRNISARFAKVEAPPEAKERMISGEWYGGDKRRVRYDTGGFYPLRTIEFPLSQADSVEAVIRNRFHGEDEWRFAARINLFRFNGGNGEIITSGALETESRAPYWELEAAGEAAFSSIPGCRIRWAVYELLFLGRGQGPWTLAWGNGEYGPQGGLPEAAGAGIEEARPLGASQYRPRAVKAPREGGWGPLVLWGILLLAAAILSGLAFYIAKSMAKGKQ
jgi:hypothetical protein